MARVTPLSCLAIDLGGATAEDRYCLPLIARGLRRLNEQMAMQRERLGRRRQEWTEDDHVA